MVNHQNDLVRALFSKGQPMVFSKGDIILGNQAEPDGIYFISTGYVKLYSISDSGDEYLHMLHGHGEIFPLTWAYLNLAAESVFYEAISDCLVWRISRDQFITNANSDINLCFALCVQLAQQFQASMSRIDNLEYKRASERVAYGLLFMASRFGKKEESSIVIQAPLTHELFANSINLVRESVSREIETLERQHLIERNQHLITILDAKSLTKRLSDPSDLYNWHLF